MLLTHTQSLNMYNACVVMMFDEKIVLKTFITIIIKTYVYERREFEFK